MLFCELLELVGLGTVLLAPESELEALEAALAGHGMLALELEQAHEQARPRVARFTLRKDREKLALAPGVDPLGIDEQA
jgi:hypothetical protein